MLLTQPLQHSCTRVSHQRRDAALVKSIRNLGREESGSGAEAECPSLRLPPRCLQQETSIAVSCLRPGSRGGERMQPGCGSGKRTEVDRVESTLYLQKDLGV